MGRFRWGSRPVRIAGAVALVLALAAIAAPFLIPIDSYRPLLVWAVENATGRDVQIDALKLSLVPTLHVTVVNFKMKNPPGFPAGDALTASSVDLGIAADALLSRRLDITYIAPAGVQVNVLRDATGRTNFAPDAPAAATPGASAAARVFTLERIGPVTVKDAQLTFGDSDRPATLTMRGVTGTIGSIDPQASDWAKKLDITADLRNAQLTMSMVAAPIDFHSGALTIANGSARSTFSLSSGSVTLSGSAKSARLDPLTITFAVSAPELDLKTLPAFLTDEHDSGSAKPAAAGHLLAHGTVAIGKLAFAPLAATQLRGQLFFYTNAVRLNAMTLSAYGGSVHGNAALNGSSGVPVSLSAQLRGINVHDVLAAVGSGTPAVSGALDATLHLTTLLTRNPEAALRSTGSFAVRNGSFPSVAFNGQLTQVAQTLGLNVPSGNTAFSYLGGDLSISRERGYSNQLTLDASGMRGTGRGSFGFDQSLQYSGSAVVDPLTQQSSGGSSPVLALVRPFLQNALQKQIGADQVRVPFSLRGTLNNPQFAVTGTPQLITAQGSSQSVVPSLGSSSIQSLVNTLIPGL